VINNNIKQAVEHFSINLKSFHKFKGGLKMKKYVPYLSVFMILIMAGAVAFAGHESMTMPWDKLIDAEKTRMPIPSGGDLRQYIVGQEPYKTWQLWPGKGKMYEGTEPHGAILTTYVNDIAHRSIKKMKGMENNAIIVKENYTPEKKLAAVTVMYKVKGYNPEGGDWFWVKYDPVFNIQKEGKVEGCLGCHGNASNNDYVFTGEVVK
jgi:hypothetical protein